MRVEVDILPGCFVSSAMTGHIFDTQDVRMGESWDLCSLRDTMDTLVDSQSLQLLQPCLLVCT